MTRTAMNVKKQGKFRSFRSSAIVSRWFILLGEREKKRKETPERTFEKENLFSKPKISW